MKFVMHCIDWKKFKGIKANWEHKTNVSSLDPSVYTPPLWDQNKENERFWLRKKIFINWMEGKPWWCSQHTSFLLWSKPCPINTNRIHGGGHNSAHDRCSFLPLPFIPLKYSLPLMYLVECISVTENVHENNLLCWTIVVSTSLCLHINDAYQEPKIQKSTTLKRLTTFFGTWQFYVCILVWANYPPR